MDTKSHEEVCKTGDMVVVIHDNSIKLLLVTSAESNEPVRYTALKITSSNSDDVLELVPQETYTGRPTGLPIGRLRDFEMRYLATNRPLSVSQGVNTFIAKLLKLKPSDLTPTQRHHT